MRTEAPCAAPHLLHYCLTPLSTPTRPPPRKSCLPWNQSLAPERSGAAALEDLPKSGALSPREGQVSWRWPPFVGGGLPHVCAARWKGLWGDLWACVPLPVGSFCLRAGGAPSCGRPAPLNWASVSFLSVSICCCLFILFLFLSELTGFITTEM